MNWSQLSERFYVLLPSLTRRRFHAVIYENFPSSQKQSHKDKKGSIVDYRSGLIGMNHFSPILGASRSKLHAIPGLSGRFSQDTVVNGK